MKVVEIHRKLTNRFSHWWQEYPLKSFPKHYQDQTSARISQSTTWYGSQFTGWIIPITTSQPDVTIQPPWTSGGGAMPRRRSLRCGAKLGQTDSAWQGWCYPGWWWHLPGSLYWTLAWGWSYSPEMRGWMGDWYSTTWTGDQLWAAGGGANSLPTQPHLWRISGRGCAASWPCQGPLLSDDRDERSQRRKSHPGCHQPRKFHKSKFNFVSAKFFSLSFNPISPSIPFPFHPPK